MKLIDLLLTLTTDPFTVLGITLGFCCGVSVDPAFLNLTELITAFALFPLSG